MRRVSGARKRRKYHNVPTEFRGEMYDSRAEAARAAQLELLKKGGKIFDWRRGSRAVLVDKKLDGKRVVVRAITYKPDFEVDGEKLEFVSDGSVRGRWWEDVKGVRWDKKKKKYVIRMTQQGKLRIQLWMHRYPGRELRIVDKDGTVHARYCG